MNVNQIPHRQSEVDACSMFGDFEMTPPQKGLEENEQIACPIAFILVIIPHRHCWRHGDRNASFTNQLIGSFIKIYHWTLGIKRFSIEIQNIFHAPDEIGTYLRETPLFSLPRLGFVFFNRRRTVSREIASHTFNSTR